MLVTSTIPHPAYVTYGGQLCPVATPIASGTAQTTIAISTHPLARITPPGREPILHPVTPTPRCRGRRCSRDVTCRARRAQWWCPHADSNCGPCLRRAVLYPLSYGGQEY